MNRNHGNINIAIFPSLILAAVAAGGWYNYYSELKKSQSLENSSDSMQKELHQKLEQQQIRIDQLTQAEQELLTNLSSEKKSQEQLRISLEATEAEKLQMEISMQQEVSRVTSTTAELEKELERRQSRQNLLEQKISTAGGEKLKLSSQLEQEKRKRQQLQQKIDSVSDDVVEKEKALADAESGVSELNQQLEITRQEQALLAVHVEELGRQRKQDSEHFAKLRNRLEQELNESQVEIAQLKNQMTVIKLTDDVLFNSGSASIKPDGQKVLTLIAESLNAYPDRAISIEGHTDNVPTSSNSRYASNWELSAVRALTAVNYFQQNSQVDPGRLKLVGYGENRPTHANKTEEGRRRNRRIEIILLAPGSAVTVQHQ